MQMNVEKQREISNLKEIIEYQNCEIEYLKEIVEHQKSGIRDLLNELAVAKFENKVLQKAIDEMTY